MDNYDSSMVLKTERLVLRMAALGDITTIFSASKFPDFNRGLGWDRPKSSDDLKPMIKHCQDAWRTNEGFAFSICKNDDETMVGRITIRRVRNKQNVWNIGFWTHPAFQRKGYMKEAVSEVLDFGFRSLQAIRIEADYALWNVASENLLKKFGFEKIGVKEKGIKTKGKWQPVRLVAIDNPFL